MGKGEISKVMKYELRYLDGSGSFEEMQQRVWALQRKTREIQNRTVQIAFHWDYINREHFIQTGNNLNVLQETGYKRLDGYIYDRLKGQSAEMSGANLNATIQTAWKKYNSAKPKVLSGTMSVPSFKRDQPLIINSNCVKFSRSESECLAELTLFSREYKKEHDLSSNVRFAIRLHDSTQRSILERVLSGAYRKGQCQLVYQRPKWFLFLTYSFFPMQHDLDPEKYLGVDLGECCALYASSVGEYGSLKLEGGEITAFAKQLEARKRSMQKQAAYCGEGRIGHGTKTRVADVYKMENRIANFRDTVNHRYSKALIDYAVKHQYGTIQMEDLSGIKNDTGFPKFLRHWTYFDLQEKIDAKAREHGIHVVKVNPQYTSQRCSKCGSIDSRNRKSQKEFCCLNCGYKVNADFNASQNLSIKGIDVIIQKYIGAKSKQTENNG
ncbi:MAG: transposase [Oscillospiraceae bacterium]|nr:transposase [Oscillospiraceae bacterium]